ncbi:uncharacterized protein LOC144661103 isoform X3 [Oculina patagonica]
MLKKLKEIYQGSSGRKRKVVQQDNEEDITDILTSEGEEGWLEKVLQKAKAKHGKKQSSKNGTAQDKFHDNSPPSNAISYLTGSLTKMTSNKNEGWTTRAKNGLRELENNWLQTPKERRGEIAGALNAAAEKLEKFANAGTDPVGAIRGAIEIIAAFSNIAGPHGQIIGVALNFISGFLSLFGKGTSPKPVDEVVREEIEKWYSRDLSNQAEGAISAFQKSKSFLNGVAKSGKQLSDSETTSLSAHVPVYHGVEFMGTLAAEIRNIIRGNKRKEGKKCLKYIELYVRMSILKDVILQQMAALISDSQSNIRNGVYEFQNSLRTSAKALFKFLYESDIGNNVIPYFDPDKYELTDAYMLEVLEIDNYDRSLAGNFSITVTVGGSVGQIGYDPDYPFGVSEGEGQIAILMFGSDYYWKLVPHGKNLFSIVNQYTCPKKVLCDAMLTWSTAFVDQYFVTIEHDDPNLWEITKAKDHGYRIKNKRWCNREPPDEMCNAELSYVKSWLHPKHLVTMKKDGGKTWGLRKV